MNLKGKYEKGANESKEFIFVFHGFQKQFMEFWHLSWLFYYSNILNFLKIASESAGVGTLNGEIK